MGTVNHGYLDRLLKISFRGLRSSILEYVIGRLGLFARGGWKTEEGWKGRVFSSSYESDEVRDNLNMGAYGKEGGKCTEQERLLGLL